MPPLLAAALCVFLINLPFGWWRAGVRRFSLAWFLSIHLPIPLVIAVRFAFGLGFQLYTYPILVGAFFLGQLLGSRGGRRAGRTAPSPPAVPTDTLSGTATEKPED